MSWFSFILRRAALVLVVLPMVCNVCARSRYCLTYDDFMADKWIEIPEVTLDARTEGTKFWWGGSDYNLETGDEGIEKILKKKAFVVMKDSMLLLNTHNLKFEGTRMGNGYTEAKYIGKGKLFFTNNSIDRGGNSSNAAFAGALVGGVVVGIAAGAAVHANQMRNVSCYTVSHGSYDNKGHINVRLVNDTQMSIWLMNHQQLYDLYMSEKKENNRLRASHIVPILEKAGILPEGESF